jgi:hypothetical protein
MPRLPGLVGLALVVAGCTVNITTTRQGEARVPCVLEAGQGYLSPDGRTGLGLRIGTEAYPVIWPVGFSARRALFGEIALVGPDGAVVAHEGDLLVINGEFDRDDVFHACPDPNIMVLAASSPDIQPR